MKSWKLPAQLALSVGVFALLALAILFARPKPEPKYHGKALSDWLAQMASIYPRANYEAVHALQAMGEGAVHSLTDTVENEDSPLKTKLLQYSDRFPLLADILTSKHWDRYVAVKALGEMGTNATSAIPALRKVASSNDRFLASAAKAALVLIQNESIAAIAVDCFDYGSSNSASAFGVLLQLGPHAQMVIPKVLDELQSTNDRIRLRAGNLLERVGLESPAGVAALTNLLTDPYYLLRVTGVNGLANCGDMAMSAAPSVATLLNDPESICRSSALIYFLTVVPPQAFEPYRLAVQMKTNDANPTVRLLAERVLREKQPVK